MMTQRQAVATAVRALFPEGKVTNEQLTKAQKEQIHEMVVQMFLAKQVELKNAETRSPEWIAKYVPGLVNNWIRKDPDLNGGGKYEPKNPGSRTGSGDETLKAMKGLLAITTDGVARAEIQKAIDARAEELKPKPVVIDLSKIPEHLRKFMPTA